MNAKGIYIAQFGNPTDPILLADPRISGEFHSYKWSSIEPSPGVFKWAKLDSDLGVAKAVGKHLAIAINTGAYTPQWAASVAQGNALQMVIASHGGDLGSGQSVQIPIPWDHIYQSSVASMISAVAAHLADIGMLDVVSQIKLTGVTEQTEETRMPCLQRVKLAKLDGKPQTAYTTNATPLWQEVGYTKARAEQAWHQIAHQWAITFPGVQLSMPVILIGGFPTLDDAGQPTGSPGTDVATTADLVMQSATTWQRRFRVQHNSLNPTYSPVNQSLLLQAKGRGALVGFQFSDIMYGPGTLPDPASVDTAITVGLNLGMDYVEVFPNWVASYSPALTRLHNALG